MAGHSKLGASSSHRWMHCPGSVAAIDAAGVNDNGSEHAARGTVAHWIASECLIKGQDAWEHAGHADTVDGHRIAVDADDLAAVQVYLDAARASPLWSRNKRLVEHAFHVPEIDEQFYGTSDLVLRGAGEVEVWDYKHGVGVTVSAERNTQLMMYAAGVILSLKMPRSTVVRLIIAQPRGFHPDGAVRSWSTTAAELLDWIRDEWKPAAARTGPGAPLVSGDWCRFCPVRLTCDETTAAVARAKAMEGKDMKTLEPWELSALLADCLVAGIVRKAAEDEVFGRLQRNEPVDGYKLVPKRADRVWKEGAEAELAKALGDDAYERRLRTPPVVEKLPGGKALVASLAFKPDNGLTVAPVDDAREGRKARGAKEIFGTLA